MKILSSKEKTDFLITSLNPCAFSGSNDEFLCYGYAYFELTSRLKEWLCEYTDNWRKGIRRVTKYPIEVFDITLIERASFESFENQQNPDFKYVNYDSLSFIQKPPVFNETDKHYQISGRLLCSFKTVVLEIERIPDGTQSPSVIYRSPNYIYYDLLDNNLIK